MFLLTKRFILSIGVLVCMPMSLLAFDVEGVFEKDPLYLEFYKDSSFKNLRKGKTLFPSRSLRTEFSYYKNSEKKTIAHGLAKEFSEDGKLLAQGMYLQGSKSGLWVLFSPRGYTIAYYHYNKLHGSWKRFSNNDILLEEKSYSQGFLHGENKSFFLNGSLANSVSYLKGKKIGLEEAWYENTNKALEQNWIQGKRHGSTTAWSTENQLIYTGSYFHDIPQGQWRWFDGQGSLLYQSIIKKGTGTFIELSIDAENKEQQKWYVYKEMSLVKGHLEGVVNTLDKNKKRIKRTSFLQGIPSGVYESFDENGRVIEEGLFAEDGELQEKTVYWQDPSLEKKVFQRLVFKDKEHFFVEVFNKEGVLVESYDLLEGKKHGDAVVYWPTHGGLVAQEGLYVSGKRHGEWKKFSSQGSLLGKQEYLYGIKHGSYELWKKPSGKKESFLKVKGEYLNGQPHSSWLYFSSKGHLLTLISYKFGVKDGNYAEYFKNSDQIKLQGIFTNGSKHGLWSSWFKNGLKKSEGRFEYGLQNGKASYWYDYLIGDKPVFKMFGEYLFGKKNGLWISFYRNGNRQVAQTFSFDRLHGEVYYFYEVGRLKGKANFYQGIKHGVEEFYYPNETVEKQREYKQGILEGIETTYYSNGNKAYEGEFFLGQRIGKWIWYHAQTEDVIKESFFENGSGNWYVFNEEGILREESYYNKGVLSGEHKTFYENLTLKVKDRYLHGVLSGLQEEFSQNGTLIKKKIWEKGVPNSNYVLSFGNGRKKQEGKFVGSLVAGQYFRWYDNGMKKTEGSWKFGVRHGQWIWFNRDGSLKGEKRFFYGMEL
jgi:uncharacterized protein